ncbi:MAG: hypothetical protein VB108_05450 [Anaerolineaceae bacterium]|nr:hypothetical protein [Anaerolineaceae bacterium]
MTLPSLLKPTVKTKFQVDFDWWKSQDRNWRHSLLAYLCEEHQALFASFENEKNIDLVDLKTGEVSQGDAMLNTLVDHCALQPDFISQNAPLVDSIFKVFLVNHNQAMNAEELSAMLGKPASTILSTIGTGRVYKGIRPI